MNRLRKFNLLAFLLFAGIAYGQTVDDIINKHIDAIGGKEVISKITSQVTSYEIKAMGMTMNAVTTMVTGLGFKYVSNIEGQESIQCITPIGGWSINPLKGEVDPTPLPQEQVKAAQIALQPGGDLYNLYNDKENGNKFELVGRAKEQGVDAYKIKLTSSDGKQVSNYFIHPTTYYIIKREVINHVNGREITATSTYNGHTKTDIGLVLPFITKTNSQGSEMITSITKVEFNKEIDLKIFQMPN